MPFSQYGLDKFVSQNLSQLTQCCLPEIASRFPESDSWVGNYLLNTTLRYQATQEHTAFALAFLRRAETAFIEYELARHSLTEYVNTNPKKPSLYFRALNHFEFTIASLWQAYDLMRRYGRDDPDKKMDLFQPGDGSSYQRLNEIYNASRHFKPERLPPDHLHAVWLTNDGIQSNRDTPPKDCVVSFLEVEDFLTEIGQWADGISSFDYQALKDVYNIP